MAYEHTEGMVLRKVDFSDTSRIVTFLTPCFGRIACMARGARRKGSPLGSALDTFNQVELTFIHKESRQVQLLTEASVSNFFPVVKGDIQRMAAAAFLLDVADAASHENNPAPDLYQALIAGMEELTKPDKSRLLPGLVSAIYAILTATGLAPYQEDELFVLHTRGCTGAERRAIRQTVEMLNGGCPVVETEAARPTLSFLHQYSTHQFECSLKSYPFLKSMLLDGRGIFE